MPRHTISNRDDVIDSRDVIARIEELESEREALADAIENIQEGDKPENADENSDYANKLADATADLAEWDEDNGDELTALKKLADDGESCAPDWTYGETLIRESYFVDYCRELVVDIGDLPKNIPSYLEIDWEKTADNLRQDYSEVEYGEVTYLIR